MKFKRLVLSVLATSMLVGAPLSYAARPGDRLEQRMKFHSNLSCEAVQGPGAFSKEWIDANISDDVDYNNTKENKNAYSAALNRLTAIQCDALRDVVSDWKFPEITVSTYDLDPEVEVPEEGDSGLEIIHQKNDPLLVGKTSQQLAHDWQEKTGEKTAALVCANAQYKLGRVFDSSSQEEGLAQQSANLIAFMTSVIVNGAMRTYYENGEIAARDRYCAENSMIMNNVTLFKDHCMPAIAGFRCGVCERLKEDPNSLSRDDLMQVNLLFHAAADKDQVKANGDRGYFYDEFEHIFKVCKKEGIKCIVVSKFGTGSFAADRKAAEAMWDADLIKAYDEVGRKLGIRVIVADGAPKAAEPTDKNEFIERQKRETKEMLERITRKSPVAVAAPASPWGI